MRKTEGYFAQTAARVGSFCRSEGLLKEPLRLAAAVSGGADSMALLRLLLAMQPEFGFALSACHVNHGLRGASADRDEAFVRAECARLGVPLRVFGPADAGMAPPAHPGEDWARQLRYACFAQLRREGIDCIATAHTGSDQAETLLFRLARGTGLHGAGGIRPQREGFVRPLLCLTRADTEAVCAACGQRWVNDETNEADDYARNRLRHRAVPALKSVNAAAEENLARFCERAARADAYFAKQAGLLLEAAAQPCGKRLPAGAARAQAAGQEVWSVETLRTAEPLILEAALHRLTAPVRDAEEKYIRLLAALVETGSGAVQLTEQVRFCAAGGVLWQELPELESLPQLERAQPFLPAQQAEYPLAGGQMLKTRLIPAVFQEKTQGVHKKDLKNQADYARITTLSSALVLRCRQPGDRFRPAGRGVSKELRKWMNETGVPPRLRDALPILAAGSEVIWVCGAGFADGFAPGPDSRQLLQMELQNREDESNYEHER